MSDHEPFYNFELWQFGHTDPRTIADSRLFTRLAQTIDWCVRRYNVEGQSPSHRSKKLAPRTLPDGRDDMVCDVGLNRSRTMSEPSIVADFPSLAGGQLMVYFPDSDLFDGAAALTSKGFFDVHNAPPRDTWVSYFTDPDTESDGFDRWSSSHLLAYVPAKLVDLANRGIEVNPEQCILWLPAANIRLRQRLAPLLETEPWWKEQWWPG
jgi:hypothetical protein